MEEKQREDFEKWVSENFGFNLIRWDDDINDTEKRGQYADHKTRLLWEWWRAAIESRWQKLNPNDYNTHPEEEWNILASVNGSTVDQVYRVEAGTWFFADTCNPTDIKPRTDEIWWCYAPQFEGVEQ